MPCCQHWKQSWMTTQHIPLQLVLWWQNLSSRLYGLLWPQHYLQNKGNKPSFLRYDSFRLWITIAGCTFFPQALLCLSWLWPSPCHPHQQQKSIQSSLDRLHWYDIQILGSCCQHSWSGAPTGRPRKSEFVPEDPPRPCFDILNAERDSNNNKKALLIFNLHLLQP